MAYSVGHGGWASDGIATSGIKTEGNVTSVQCLSTHLTSFAVLVDVAGGLQVCQYVVGVITLVHVFIVIPSLLLLMFLQDISKVEGEALQIISYIGCAISAVCLIISIVFFLLQG